LKKEITSPNTSSFKTYFYDPYFCIIYSRAKLLVLDVRQILTPGMIAEFQEIQTMLHLKQNFKMLVQPIHNSGKGPTDIAGFHYSSQSRGNEVFHFGMQVINDPNQLASWRASLDAGVERQIAETGMLLILGMKRSDLC
jgi:hypothetical protein